jgi:hypothetical protein
MRNELPVEGNAGYHSVFTGVRNITLVPNSCIEVNGTRPVYHVRKPLMLAARGSSTCLAVRIELN